MVKLPDIPPEIAHRFVAAMQAYSREHSQLRRDEIAAEQLFILRQHLPGRARLRLSDVKELFEKMR